MAILFTSVFSHPLLIFLIVFFVGLFFIKFALHDDSYIKFMVYYDRSKSQLEESRKSLPHDGGPPLYTILVRKNKKTGEFDESTDNNTWNRVDDRDKIRKYENLLISREKEIEDELPILLDR